ncbi:MAG: hypothetical protein E7301_04485 [Butyrivibrio sp.]|uniref:hypothetical protein n=1 Tax=Butyrivibrio sp. NC2002 TaxID=1410610 RepID=UPI0005601CD7|nr:hypothetical protein [Butyrivibrio sp. NC2002]MBE5859367.1 hypothetical protein [Butyrivibrio sp.]
MTLDAYFNPDFTWPKKLIYLLLAFLFLLFSILMIFASTQILVPRMSSRQERKEALTEKFYLLVQLFYEMIISATSVMTFACSYVILNHIYTLILRGEGSGIYAQYFLKAWEGAGDFILLLLICLSCVINTILDHLIVPLKKISKEEMASVRMLAMFYVIITLVCLNIIGDESEYSPVMMYYLGLMIGRFVYFDASFADFANAIKNTVMKLPLLILGLLATGLLCYLGFYLGYLLERNYYIVGLIYTHLFFLVAIFILHHTKILQKIFPKIL